MQETLEIEPRKRPRQRRAQLTFDALVDACARLLPELGYAGVTTNHVAQAANVNITSLYEYFPGKDAIVAQVAERLVNRVLVRLRAHMAEILSSNRDDSVRHWIEAVYSTLNAEKRLVAVFVYEVPYTNRLPQIRAITPLLLQFSEAAREAAGKRISLEHPRASLYLLINLVSSTILGLVLSPPEDVSQEEMIDCLTHRVETWLTGAPAARFQRGSIR